jgi:hypothetical protein
MADTILQRVVIREATPNDIPAIAQVHLDAWLAWSRNGLSAKVRRACGSTATQEIHLSESDGVRRPQDRQRSRKRQLRLEGFESSSTYVCGLNEGADG